MKSKYILAVCCVLGVIASVRFSGRADERSSGSRFRRKNPVKRSAVQDRQADWGLFCFGGGNNEIDAYRIKKITLVTNIDLSKLYGKNGIPIPGIEQRRIELSSEKKQLLEDLEFGMWRPFRYAIPKELGGGSGGGGGALATLHVETTNRSFDVLITMVGFALGGPMAQPHNVFFSWTLAKHLDDFYFEKTGKRFDKVFFETLSGERKIKLSKKFYSEIMRERKGLRAKK
jgi:hypothetical protein